MGLEFRQRGPSEYAQSLLRRKWLVLLPALAIGCAIAIAVMRLPSVYRSSALLVVKPSTLTAVLPVTDPNEMTRKLNSLTQTVTSRTSLEQLIKKYGLYKEERERGMSMDAIITKMATKDVEVEMNVRNEVINGFTVSFRGRDPRTAKAVTEELAGNCVTEVVRNAAVDNDQNKKFFEGELKKYQDEMELVERERLDFLRNNLSNLPDGQAAIVEQLSGLRDQQKTLYSEIGRLRDQVTFQKTLLSARQDDVQRRINTARNEVPDDITNSQAYAELIKLKSTLENDLKQLLKVFKEKNPDVISKREQIANVEQNIEQERQRQQQRADKKQAATIESLSINTPETATIGANIDGLENERRRQEALLGQVDREISSINQRLSNIPSVQVNLEAINRRFQTANTQYNGLLEKSQKAGLINAADQNSRGEAIILQDAANLPQTPVAPKRPVLIGLGLFLGLGVGVFLALFAEAPRFFTIQTMDDAEHYTGLPVLVALPELMTPQESKRRPRIHLVYLVAGVLVSLVSIPVLVKALSITQLFERFVL